MADVGFVGLGVMGAPMAGHLLTHGHKLTVWNRTASKAAPLGEKGANVAKTLGDLGANCDLVFLCVSRTEDVQECVDELLRTSRDDTLFVDHSTILPEGAKDLHVLVEKAGSRFLDAPITGGSVGAEKGQLTIFCGGRSEDFARAQPVMSAYAKRAELVGGPGAGQTMKLANQIAVGGAVLALCESLAFAKKAGLDLAQTRDMLSTGAAASWALDNYGPKILAKDWSPGFSIKNQRKDFAYTIKTADVIGAEVPGTALVDALLVKLEALGHGDWTTAALYEVLVNEGGDK